MIPIGGCLGTQKLDTNVHVYECIFYVFFSIRLCLFRVIIKKENEVNYNVSMVVSSKICFKYKSLLLGKYSNFRPKGGKISRRTFSFPPHHAHLEPILLPSILTVLSSRVGPQSKVSAPCKMVELKLSKWKATTIML